MIYKTREVNVWVNFLQIFFLAIGLSMDTFAVAVTIGLASKKPDFKKAVVSGFYFGFFQGAMPVIGFFAATLFAEHITAYSHFLAFGLLGFVGGKMIWGSFKPSGDESINAMSPRQMITLAVATSIDAMAVGISFAFLQISIIPAALTIGVVTFIISGVGVCVGSFVGARFGTKATFVGGAILIIIGLRILIMGIM